jgi:hypothetical protein
MQESPAINRMTAAAVATVNQKRRPRGEILSLAPAPARSAGTDSVESEKKSPLTSSCQGKVLDGSTKQRDPVDRPLCNAGRGSESMLPRQEQRACQMFLSNEEGANCLIFDFGTIAIYGMQLRHKHRHGT